MKVIDLSAWQENVDWQGLKEEGINGVILKIGEQSMRTWEYYLDEMFVSHVNNAVKYGFKYGVYFYSHAYTREMAIKDADVVATWLKEYLRGETPELGIWYDAEDKTMLQGDVTENCITFLNQLTNYGHGYQGIYASWDWLSKEGAGYIDMDSLPDYVPYWVANYSSKDYLKSERPDKLIRIWQYTDHYSDSFPYDGNIYYEV